MANQFTERLNELKQQFTDELNEQKWVQEILTKWEEHDNQSRLSIALGGIGLGVLVVLIGMFSYSGPAPSGIVRRTRTGESRAIGQRQLQLRTWQAPCFRRWS